VSHLIGTNLLYGILLIYTQNHIQTPQKKLKKFIPFGRLKYRIKIGIGSNQNWISPTTFSILKYQRIFITSDLIKKTARP
jgi:hypothetical protein